MGFSAKQWEEGISVSTSSSTTAVHADADVEAIFDAVEGVESNIKPVFEGRISRKSKRVANEKSKDRGRVKESMDALVSFGRDSVPLPRM